MRWVVLWFGCVALWLAGDSALAQAGASAAASPASQADDNVARGLFQAGKSAYEAGNFKEALQFFEQAYQHSPRPGFLFNIGQAADRLRQDDKALASFKAYLEQMPDAQNRAAVQQRVDALEDAKRQREEAAAAVAPMVPNPATVAARADASTAQNDHRHERSRDEASASSPVTKQWWFWTGLGAVLIGGTVIALAVSQSRGGQAPLYQGSAGSMRAP
jgi:tetratricopeptide (TPR) repeat protein